MTIIALFLKAAVIGFSIAAPVGPIGMLCIQRSLRDGFKAGLMTGLGAATADGVYGLLAVVGLTAVSSVLVSHQLSIRLTGGLFLLYLAVKVLRRPLQKEAAATADPLPAWQAYATTVFLTLTNPATVLSFAAIFAGAGIGLSNENYSLSALFVLGVFAGSGVWWVLLSGGVAYIFRHKMTEPALRNINRLSAVILLAYSASALWTCANNFMAGSAPDG
jgi:threonine/homoserine/homoserine lactone efflux protein